SSGRSARPEARASGRALAGAEETLQLGGLLVGPALQVCGGRSHVDDPDADVASQEATGAPHTLGDDEVPAHGRNRRESEAAAELGPRGVELMGIEPTTSCMPCRRSSQLSYSPSRGVLTIATLLRESGIGNPGSRRRANGLPGEK